MANSPNGLSWRAFSLPKRGNSAEEYEDAFAANPRAGRFAVADGVSESSFSGDWAKLIVDAFVENAAARPVSWLRSAQSRWQRMFENRQLSWHAEAKFNEGAFATWLGVRISPGGLWEAYAIGDCCLFHVRNDRLMRAFPVRRSTDFGRDPELLGSRPRAENGPKPKRKRLKGDWSPGDRLFLMSDALAQWFLTKWEERQHPWHALADVGDDKAFAELIDKLRDDKELRNDDVTFLIVHSSSEKSS